jgi:hypothetical protein
MQERRKISGPAWYDFLKSSQYQEHICLIPAQNPPWYQHQADIKIPKRCNIGL